MHVTSDYYRSREHLPVNESGLVERLKSPVAASRRESNVEPLRPSRRTLRLLARRYKGHNAHKHSA